MNPWLSSVYIDKLERKKFKIQNREKKQKNSGVFFKPGFLPTLIVSSVELC